MHVELRFCKMKRVLETLNNGNALNTTELKNGTFYVTDILPQLKQLLNNECRHIQHESTLDTWTTGKEPTTKDHILISLFV